jgi:hypothetical protein
MSGASEGAGTVQVKAGLSFAGYWLYFNGLGGVSARRKIENKSLFTCILGALHESTEGGSPEPSRLILCSNLAPLPAAADRPWGSCLIVSFCS